MSNKNGRPLKGVMCKKHPDFELAYFCRQQGCNRVVLCKQCAGQNHVKHLVHPVKEIRESCLISLRNYEKAIKKNVQTLETVEYRLERNKEELKNKIAGRIREYHAVLSQLEERVNRDIAWKTEEQLELIGEEKDELLSMESQLEVLVMELSDIIPSIVRANEDQHLDTNFEKLTKALEGWQVKYSIPVIDTSKLTSDVSFGDVELRAEVAKGADVIPFSRQETSSQNDTVVAPPVQAKEITSWRQRFDHLIGLTCHSLGGEGVTIASYSHVSVYKQCNGSLFHSDQHDDEIDDITSFRGRNHAVIDRDRDEVRLYTNWPLCLGNENYVINVSGRAGGVISATDNYLVFTSRMHSFVRVTCFSISRLPPRFLWHSDLIGWHRERSMSVMEKQDNLVVAVAKSFPSGIPKQGESKTVIVAIEGAKLRWRLNFHELDRDAECFDLDDMSNDGRYFYVVNEKAGCVYLISAEGQALCKIVENLYRPMCLSINTESSKMVVACNANDIKVYKLTYRA